jgi:hypothetical protein
MSLRIGLASWLGLLDADAVMVDALILLMAGFLAGGAVEASRGVATGGNASAVIRPVQWVIYALQFLSGAAGMIAVMSLLSNSAVAMGMRGAVGWLALLPLLFVSVLFHELGHYLGARRAGMKVVLMNVMGIEWYPRRKGWLMRLARKRDKSRGGYVHAVLDPGRPMRAQALWLVAAGPVASAMVCAFSIWVAWAASAQALADGAAAFAVINGVLVVVTLLPQDKPRQTDGALLLHWWRHEDDDAPALAYLRLISLSVFGATADALPEQDLQKIEADPMPMPLVAMWYRIKAAQNRADWEEAVKVGERFEQALGTLKQVPGEYASLVAHIRAEVAFSAAMASGRHDLLSEALVSRDIRQLYAHFWPRCLALKAAMGGAVQEAEGLLQQVMHEANRSIDLALPKSEAMLARHILARVPMLDQA